MIANKLRKGLDRKVWQPMAQPIVTPTSSMFAIADYSGMAPEVMFMSSVTAPSMYNCMEDGWNEMPATGFGGTSLAGASGTYHPHGPTGTATAGSSTTLSTNLTIPRSLAGYTIRITGGPGIGDERVIASNTWGANSVITVTQPFSATITAASTYLILSGRFWFMQGGTIASSGFGYWDIATSTWVSGRSITGLPATFGTDARMVATSNCGGIPPFSTGTATQLAVGATLDCSTKTWTVNQWTNSQVRITGGTGVGQLRSISSNTATQLTVSAAWTIQPDATSTFAIEGNEDYIYLLGNASVAMYRYSISNNTWTTLSPVTPRAASVNTSFSADWVHSATDPLWTDESAIQNGRYIYSHRGSGSQAIDIYDIAGNTWIARNFANQSLITFSTGSYHTYYKNRIYFQKEATGRIYALDVTRNVMEGYSVGLWPQSTAVVGNRMWIWRFQSDADELGFLYFMGNSTLYLQRTPLLLD